MPPSTYRDQFVKLIDKGYLVQRKNSNTYDFYETPQRDTHTKNNDTPDGLDFTADVQDVPQTVNDEAAEDIEININNTDNINSGLLEKQVSPTPLRISLQRSARFASAVCRFASNGLKSSAKPQS